MRVLAWTAAAAVMVVQITAVACAQTSSPVTVASGIPPASIVAPVAAGCELHVWPAHDFHSTYMGLVHGGIVDGAAKQRDGYPALPGPLDSAEQVRLLNGLPIADWLGLSGYRTVIHDQPLARQEVRGDGPPHIAAAPACYAELMLDDVVLQDHALDTAALNVILRYRRFEGAPNPQRTFGSYVLQRTASYPVKPGSDVAAAHADLATAFSSAVKAFGVALNRPPRKHI